MLASRGETTPPWGVPLLLFLPPVIRRFPPSSLSSTGDFSHSLSKRRIFPSATLRATLCNSSAWGMVSKYCVTSASTTCSWPPYNRFRTSASASWGTALRPVGMDVILEVSLEDRFKEKHDSALRHPVPRQTGARQVPGDRRRALVPGPPSRGGWRGSRRVLDPWQGHVWV